MCELPVRATASRAQAGERGRGGEGGGPRRRSARDDRVGSSTRSAARGAAAAARRRMRAPPRRTQRLELVLARGAGVQVPLERARLVGVERVERESRPPGRASEEVGSDLEAPSAYQTPKSRLSAPRAGASRLKARRAGPLESVIPKPVESAAIEIAVKTANSASATRRRRGRGSRRAAGCRRLRCRPCRGRGRSRTPAAARGHALRGRADVGGPASWPRRQRTSSQTASPMIRTPTAVSAACWTTSGQVRLEEHDRQAEREQRGRVPEAPREAEPRRERLRPVAAGGDQCRHGGEVVRVGRVPQAEQHGDAGDGEQRGAVERCAIQWSRPNISRSPWGGRAGSSRGRGRARRAR